MVDFRAQCSYLKSSNNPSFSSSLLDAIYRSIDSGEEDAAVYREDIMRKKQNYSGGGGFASEEDMANFRRACMIEKWMEKKVSEKASVRQKLGDDLKTNKFRKERVENSSSSSSDSSASCGFFSSSEAESFPVAVQRPKPVRTGGSVKKLYEAEEQKPAPKSSDGGGGFLKTKSRALKLYGDLKKVKQSPVSPGGKLAGFLNSLFAGANPKKPKPADSPSNCSSASSFTRSCLSKTPSSRGKSSSSTAAVKRSVRFSPVSVILDGDDSRPFEHKSLHQSSKTRTPNHNDNIDSIRSVIKEELMDKNRRVEEVARDLLRNYHRKTCNQSEYQIDQLRKPQIKNQVFDHNFDEEEEDGDDAASYASSDLFELDNLSAIGMEELPVYETTHLSTNQAIANGYIL